MRDDIGLPATELLVTKDRLQLVKRGGKKLG
jgi:hypothetical protein